MLACLEIQYGHKQLGMERTTTCSLVPFQPFQAGRNKLRHALRFTCSIGTKGTYEYAFIFSYLAPGAFVVAVEKMVKKVGSKAQKKSKKIVLKAGSKAQKKRENRTQGVRSDKVPRLCYNTEPETLSHYRSYSRSRRQPYQVIWWLMILDDLLHLYYY